MKNKIKNFLSNKRVLSYTIIIFIAIFISIPMFSKYMDIARDDGIQHICRIIGVLDSVKENKLFPVIMSNFCNGFGYSWNIFYSPITAYVPLIFSLFTSSAVIILKLSLFLTLVLSGVFMYKFTFQISKSYKASVISAIIYMSAPYHLTNLYNRIAIAELAAIVFLPILFRGMYCLIHDNQKKPYNIAIGAIGLILSQSVIALYSAIFCLIYILINFKKLKNKNVIKAICINVVLILLITSFYIFPLLEHRIATNYEVFKPGRMYEDNIISMAKLTFPDLFITEPFGMNFHIGIPIIIGLVLCVVYFRKFDKRYTSTIITFLIFGLASLFVTVKIFPFEHLPAILKMLQFPWRMKCFEMLFLGVVSGISIAMLINRNPKLEIGVIIIVMISLSLITITSMRKVTEPFNEEEFKPAVQVTPEYSIHPGLASFEYLPTKAFENRRYFEERSQDVIILDGNATVTDEVKSGTNLKFNVKDINETTQLELPYIYYLGYSAKLKMPDGTEQKTKITESPYGFCMIQLENIQDAEIQISYTGTIIMKITYATSIIGLVGLIIYIKIGNKKYILGVDNNIDKKLKAKKDLNRVLILSCGTGGGHNSAARAIEKDLKQKGVKADFIEYLEIINLKIKNGINNLYIRSTNKNGKVFKQVYRLGELYEKTKLKSPIYRLNSLSKKKLYKYIKDNKYNYIVTTHLFAAQALTAIKKEHDIHFIAIATDYVCIPFWKETNPDYFIVPNEDIKQDFIKKGIKEEKLLPLGIPVDKRYSKKYSKEKCKEELKLDKNKKYVLIVNGSMGFGDIIKEVEELINNIPDVTFIVSCGNNKKALKELKSKFKNNKRVIKLPYTDKLNKYMAVSEVVLTKPGGLTTTEIATMRKPIIHTMPIPGCENYNANFFESKKMSIKCNTIEEIIDKLNKLLSDPIQQEEIVENQEKYVNAHSCDEITDLIINEVKSRRKYEKRNKK